MANNAGMSVADIVLLGIPNVYPLSHENDPRWPRYSLSHRDWTVGTDEEKALMRIHRSTRVECTICSELEELGWWEKHD